MSNPQQRIESLVSKFQSDLVALAGELASETIASALGGSGGSGVANKLHLANGSNGTSSVRSTSHGAKRDPKALAELGGRFAAFVKAHPGLRIEQINKQLGTTTQHLALPIRKLIASGEIKVKGEKRSTMYFAGGAAASASKIQRPSKIAAKRSSKRRRSR
jgi:hypothetical protein